MEENIMEVRHSLKYGLIFFLLVFGLIGCAGFSPKAPSPDYIAGKKYADGFAKQDAIKGPCGQILTRNLNKHQQKLAGSYSQDFIDGFSYGYKKGYNEYRNLYCLP